VPGLGEDFLDGTAFDDLAGVGDGDAVGELRDDPEVVGDEEDGHAEFAAQLVEEFEDLGLDGDIQGGGGFIGDEQAGARGESHGDGDSLLHASGQLVWVLPSANFG
jgi:hypothetical protein